MWRHRYHPYWTHILAPKFLDKFVPDQASPGGRRLKWEFTGTMVTDGVALSLHTEVPLSTTGDAPRSAPVDGEALLRLLMTVNHTIPEASITATTEVQPAVHANMSESQRESCSLSALQTILQSSAQHAVWRCYEDIYIYERVPEWVAPQQGQHQQDQQGGEAAAASSKGRKRCVRLAVQLLAAVRPVLCLCCCAFAVRVMTTACSPLLCSVRHWRGLI